MSSKKLEPHPMSETGLEIALEITDPAKWLGLVLTKPPAPSRYLTVGEAIDHVESLARHAIARARQLDSEDIKRLRKAARKARQRFSEQNGVVSQDVWEGNYDAVKEIDNALAATEECMEARREERMKDE